MTSKKRVEIGPGEGEVEPKQRRIEDEGKEGIEDFAEESGEHVSAAPPQQQLQLQAKKGRDWLHFSGRRHPRVGEDFQVSSLPSPSESKNVGTRGNSHTKHEED